LVRAGVGPHYRNSLWGFPGALGQASENGRVRGDLLAHFDEGADDIDARMSAHNIHLDADLPLRNSSTDWKEQQRFLAWQKVAV
jgi:hypothetical protein